jgi:hypothetical protein
MSNFTQNEPVCIEIDFRVRRNPSEYKENLFLKVKIWSKTTSKQTVLKMKFFKPSLKGGSTKIDFKEGKVIVPKGFKCSFKLKIKDNCWYKELPKPREDNFVSSDGQLLLSNFSFQVHGAADEHPHFCPISRIFIRPLSLSHVN